MINAIIPLFIAFINRFRENVEEKFDFRFFLIPDRCYFIIKSSSEKVDIYGYETATLASAGFAVSFFVPFSTLKVQMKLFLHQMLHQNDICSEFHH